MVTPRSAAFLKIPLGILIVFLIASPFAVNAQATIPSTSQAPGSTGASTTTFSAITASDIAGCVNPLTGGPIACLGREVFDATVSEPIKQAAADAALAVAEDVGTVVVKAVGSVILTIANLLLSIAGVLLNFVVVKTVFEFGSVIGNSPGILVAWGIFRDLGNLVLLFGFIFMGLAMILNLNTFSAQKAIPRLLLFAILMNFSLFAAEAVIDTTNAVSSVIYSQAADSKYCEGEAGKPLEAQGNGGSKQNDATAVNALNECAVNYGIAGHIMQSTGLSTMWKVNDAGFGATTATYIGLALFATIGAVVLFAAAIMLSIRLVVLSFLMVTAPIGFAGMAIPPLQKYAKMWWDKLISQSIFAPVLFLLIFVSLKITDSFAGSAGELSLAGALTQPNTSIMGIILVFVLVIGFMVASLVAARSIGAQGANGLTNFAVNLPRKVGGGFAGVVGRNTVGRGTAALQKRYEASMGKNGGKGFGRSIIRNLGIDEAVAGTLGAGQKAKFGSSKSFEDKKKRDKERKDTFEKAARKVELEEAVKRAVAIDPNAPGNSEEQRNDAIAQALERLSVKELEELDVLKKSGKDLDELVKNLSPEKFSALVKDGGALSEDKKKALKESRFSEIRKNQEILADPAQAARHAAAEDAIKKQVKAFSVKDFESAPADLLTDDEVAKNLTNSQRDDLIKNGKLSPAAIRKVKEFDPVEQINKAYRANNSGADAVAYINGMAKKPNNKQISRLDTNFLISGDFAQIASINMLKAIQERDEITSAEARTIGANIQLNGIPRVAAYVISPEGAYWS